MREHKFETLGSGDYCVYCGAKQHDLMDATCIERSASVTQNMPEPKLRTMAADSFDDIRAHITRIKDLERQQ
jgi:hypothetical protein